jgi:hypothetical protein
MVVPPPLDPVIAAKVPAPRRAKDSPFDWLANLATRAIRECLHGSDVPLRTTAVLMALPDRYREHAALTRGPHALMHAVETRLRGSFHSSSVAIPEGHAGAVHAIGLARSLLDTDTVSHCLVGGVDSLVNAADVQRLSAAGRLHEAGNPQGLIPGEGAGYRKRRAVRRGPRLAGCFDRCRARGGLCRIAHWFAGIGHERRAVLRLGFNDCLHAVLSHSTRQPASVVSGELHWRYRRGCWGHEHDRRGERDQPGLRTGRTRDVRELIGRRIASCVSRCSNAGQPSASVCCGRRRLAEFRR